ncbi:MAG: HEAT repeat domain-containing protein [Bacteroidota bacterium]
MELTDILVDNKIKPKEKTEILSNLVLEKQISVDQLTDLARSAKEPVRATCIEALEHVTLANPGMLTESAFDFVVKCLADKAPRVKWESARVIGNTAALFPGKLDQAVNNLLDNTEHPGTVVRWSAAFALGAIIRLKTGKNDDLVPACEAIVEREEKNSIKKIYLDAIRKTAARP